MKKAKLILLNYEESAFNEKLTVHIMTGWPQVSQEARRSTWLIKALNRRRFRKHIRGTALKIKWCLKPEHREKMRVGRFCTLV